MVQAVRRISIESYAIAFIALLDLVVTIMLVGGEHAYEGNPLMRYYLGHGVGFFVFAKLVFTAMPIIILEWARRHRPDFVRRVSRLAIAGYVGFYAVMFVKVNVPTIVADYHRPQYHWIEMPLPNAEDITTTGPLVMGPVLLVPHSWHAD